MKLILDVKLLHAQIKCIYKGVRIQNYILLVRLMLAIESVIYHFVEKKRLLMEEDLILEVLILKNRIALLLLAGISQKEKQLVSVLCSIYSIKSSIKLDKLRCIKFLPLFVVPVNIFIFSVDNQLTITLNNKVSKIYSVQR